MNRSFSTAPVRPAVSIALVRALAPVTLAGSANVSPDRYRLYLMVRKAIAGVPGYQS